jgi:hypothetical protein
MINGSPPSTRDRWLEHGTMLEGWALLVAWLQIQCLIVYRACTSKRKSHDRVLMRLIHSRRRRTGHRCSKGLAPETAGGRGGTSWGVGKVGKHGLLFLFDLIRGLEKARVEARQVGKLGIAGRNVQAAGIHQLSRINRRPPHFPLLEMLGLPPVERFW